MNNTKNRYQNFLTSITITLGGRIGLWKVTLPLIESIALCIAGGRQDGYLYVDWIGNIYPCVFVPYWKDNIHDLYKNEKLFTDALFSTLFTGWRGWQKSYNSNDPSCSNNGNLIRPCLMRDHHHCARDILLNSSAKPGNASAKKCLNDKIYSEALKQYDEELSHHLDPIWKEMYERNHITSRTRQNDRAE